MTLWLLAYLGGVLTLLSPCILPVLPFVFAQADQPFRRHGLPMLLGMAATFALVATLAAVGGGWVVHANQVGRWVALGVLALMGVMLLWPAITERLTRPLVTLGQRWMPRNTVPSVWGAMGLGVATGLLWTPCAGPILGLLLATAALQGAHPQTTGLLLAYALGAATALAVALWAGGRVFGWLKRSLGMGEWVRRALGALVLLGVVAIAAGVDTRFLARWSQSGTTALEKPLVQALAPTRSGQRPTGSVLDSLSGATQWFNGPPLDAAQLRGKVVLVDFWTYSCINCLRTLPTVEAWARAYGPAGLVVIGVHTPEFAFEKDPANVAKALHDLGVTYPVAMDNRYAIWNAFDNQYWPAHYFIDATGKIQGQSFGEGNDAQDEALIRQLLQGGRATTLPAPVGPVRGDGAEAAVDLDEDRSPETYVGTARAARVGVDLVEGAHTYPATSLASGQWQPVGTWQESPERAISGMAGAQLVYRFTGRDLHLVLGSATGQPIPFTVTLDGQPPGEDHGADVDAQGHGTITGQRLYQLIRQRHPGARRFTITFDSPGAQAFAFTFG